MATYHEIAEHHGRYPAVADLCGLYQLRHLGRVLVDSGADLRGAGKQLSQEQEWS